MPRSLIHAAALLIGVGSIVPGCRETMMTLYDMDQIEIVSVARSDQGTTVTYTPLLESAYYNPGVDVDSEDDAWVLEFVRCGINETCTVSHPIDPASAPPYSVFLEGAADGVMLRDKKGLHPIVGAQ